jgi:tetratricopeptide (TPR) repeat protein
LIRKAASFVTNFSEPLKSLAVDLALLASVGLGALVIYKSALKSEFVVKDISVPAALVEKGVNGNVVPQEILDHISDIDAAAGSKKQKADISGIDFQSTMPTISLPVGGVSVGVIISELRQILGYSDKIITGEIYADDLKKSDKEDIKGYGFRLRIVGEGPIYKSTAPEIDVQNLVSAAAEQIMKRFDPINLAYYYYRKKDFEKADEIVDAALIDDNSDNIPWAYTMHGLIARDQGKLTEAADDFRHVIRIDPKFGMAYVNLSGSYRLSGQLDDAETAARKAIELLPTQQDGYAALALVLMDKGQTDEALAMMRKGVTASPHDPDGHLMLGQIQHRLEKFEDAITSFKTSATLSPASEPLMNAASSSLALQRRTEALSYLTRATHLDPKNYHVWVNLGGGYLRNHENVKAHKAFDKALTLAPHASQPVIEIADMLAAQGLTAEAEQLFAKNAHVQGSSPAFLIEWSRLLSQLGKTAEAQTKLEEADKNARDNPGDLEIIARNFEAHGEIADAVKAYRDVYAKDPSRAEVLKPYADALANRPTTDAAASPGPQSNAPVAETTDDGPAKQIAAPRKPGRRPGATR